MDLVDEQERALALGTTRARGVEDLLQFGDAGMDGRDLDEDVVARSPDQPCDRRLAAARRPPEDHRAERRPGQRPVRAGQVLLARNLGERRRPQPLGERRRRRLGLRAGIVDKAHGALSRAGDPLSSGASFQHCATRSFLGACRPRTEDAMTDTLTRTFAGLPTAEPDDIGLSRPALKRLTAVMEREIAAGRAPGLLMLIARNGKVGFAKTLGALGPGGPAMPLDAIFRIYSMTKPIVSAAAMMLVEEGRMLITDPLSEYIPAFAETKVGVENGDRLNLVPLKRPITIQDLMRHTSGLTYGFTGASQVQKLVFAANPMSQDKSAAEHVEAIAELPLRFQPGEVWEYGLSTDVLGRVIEIIAGKRLG